MVLNFAQVICSYLATCHILNSPFQVSVVLGFTHLTMAFVRPKSLQFARTNWILQH